MPDTSGYLVSRLGFSFLEHWAEHGLYVYLNGSLQQIHFAFVLRIENSGVGAQQLTHFVI